MKKTLAFLLCVLLLCGFASCKTTPKTANEILKDYDLLDETGLDSYYQALDNLTSGEITLKYSENKNSASVVFYTLENGEKTLLATVENGASKMYNYFDGENLFVIMNGEASKIDSGSLDKKVLYYNFFGAPQDATNKDAITSHDTYLKKDRSEYLIVITTDYALEGSTKLYMYLDENKTPKSMQIFDTYFGENGKEQTETITLTYSKLGEKVTFEVPQFNLIESGT